MHERTEENRWRTLRDRTLRTWPIGRRTRPAPYSCTTGYSREEFVRPTDFKPSSHPDGAARPLSRPDGARWRGNRRLIDQGNLLADGPRPVCPGAPFCQDSLSEFSAPFLLFRTILQYHIPPVGERGGGDENANWETIMARFCRIGSLRFGARGRLWGENASGVGALLMAVA